MELQNIERTGGMSGMGLNIEEISGLEVAMLQRKLEENLPGKMYFWGESIRNHTGLSDCTQYRPLCHISREEILLLVS